MDTPIRNLVLGLCHLQCSHNAKTQNKMKTESCEFKKI